MRVLFFEGNPTGALGMAAMAIAIYRSIFKQPELLMNNTESTAIVYVTYRGSATARFDRDYYGSNHLPLVMASWQQYGLESARAFYPPVAEEGTVAICECRFRDEASMTAAFTSSEAAAVMADVSRFTEIKPVRLRAVAS